MPTLNSSGFETTIPEASYPANRQPEDFEAGQRVFVHRSNGLAGITEVTAAKILDVVRYGHRPVGAEIGYGEDPSPGYVIAVTADKPLKDESKMKTRRDIEAYRLLMRATSFLGDVTDAGIVPVEFAPRLAADEALQERWLEGARWSKDYDWADYIQLLSGSLAQVRSGHTARHAASRSAGRHAHSAPQQHRTINGKTILTRGH